jgi:hypothetical protein
VTIREEKRPDFSTISVKNYPLLMKGLINSMNVGRIWISIALKEMGRQIKAQSYVEKQDKKILIKVFFDFLQASNFCQAPGGALFLLLSEVETTSEEFFIFSTYCTDWKLQRR